MFSGQTPVYDMQRNPIHIYIIIRFRDRKRERERASRKHDEFCTLIFAPCLVEKKTWWENGF